MFQALLVIPFALAIVFFTISYFQRDKVIAAANQLSKDKKVKEVVTKAKKAVNKAAKQVTAKVNKVAEKIQEKEQVIKNIIEEIDITEYASVQLNKAGQAANKAIVRAEKKVEETKTEVNKKVEEVQATATAVVEEGKKKKKKSEWQTQASSQKQAPTTAPVEEEKKEEVVEESDKRESRGVRGGRGAGRGGRGRGRGSEQSDAPKSLYKPIKPTVVEEVKPVEEEPKKNAKKDSKKEETPVEAAEEVEKKERKPLRPFVKMVPAHQAYSDPEDFWNTDLSKSYKEPVVEEVKPVVAEEVVSSPTEDPLTINDTAVPSKKEKAPRTRQPAVQQPPVILDEGMAPATIKVNNSASFARTDPWAQTDNASTEASSETKESFPALGEKAAKKKKAKKAPKEQTLSTTSQDESSNNTLVAHEDVDAKNSHKREATNTLFEYDAEAPSDKRIKLEEGSEVEHKDEPFVLQPSSN